MITKFDIIKKTNINSNGIETEHYLLRKKFLGISFYKWSLETLTSLDDIDGILGFILTILFGVLNLVSIIHFSSMLSILLIVNPIFFFLFYKLGKKKYSSLEEVEDDIKIYFKKKKFKAKSETITSYVIDMNKGIYEKEVSTALSRDN